MWTPASRWAVAATAALIVASVGCARGRVADEPRAERRPIVADDSVTHAFDTDIGARLRDKLELDNFLRDRDIVVDVADGVVTMSGEVWTPLEKARAADLIRQVAGVIDVDNLLAVRPPD